MSSLLTKNMGAAINGKSIFIIRVNDVSIFFIGKFNSAHRLMSSLKAVAFPDINKIRKGTSMKLISLILLAASIGCASSTPKPATPVSAPAQTVKEAVPPLLSETQQLTFEGTRAGE